MFLSSIETAPQEEIKSIQGVKLHKQVVRAYQKTLFYQQRMDALGLTPDNIRSVADIIKMPFMSIQEIESNYPFGLLTVPLSGVVRFRKGRMFGFQFSAGFVKGDLNTKVEAIARILASCNINMGSILLIDEPINAESALSLRQAAENAGVTVVSGVEDIRELLKTITDLNVTTLFSTNERIFELVHIAKSLDEKLPIMNLLCEVHDFSPQKRLSLEEQVDIPIYLIYGRADVMKLGIAGECYKRNGLHVQEDIFLVEIINKNTGSPVPDGQIGELVITTLSRDAMPLIRYRTGEDASIVRARCSCGRTTARLMFI